MKRTVWMMGGYALLALGAAASAHGREAPLPADAFLASLAEHCGKAYVGRITANQPASTSTSGSFSSMRRAIREWPL